MTKSFKTYFAAAITAIALCGVATSCSGNKSNDNTSDEALTFSSQGMLRQVEEALNAGDYVTAKQLADSVHITFPTDVEGRRMALHLSSKANYGITADKLARVDSLIAAERAAGNEPSAQLMHERSVLEYKLSVAKKHIQTTMPR